MTEVDLFADPPFAFEEAYARSLAVALGDLSVPVASIEDLVAMKRRAARPKDLEDVAVLEGLQTERGTPDDG